MSKNLNQLVSLIYVAQSAAADVAISAGEMFITGAQPIQINRVYQTTQVGATGGNPVKHTITLAGSATAGDVYSGSITQRSNGRLYSWSFSYECPNPAPGATAIYASIAALFQDAIDGGTIIGSVSSSVSGVVFTPSVYAPVPEVVVSATLSDATASVVTITASGSSYSSGTLTSGATSGATTGKLYRISFSGATGTDAASVNGKTFFAKATAATTFFVFGLDTGTTITTTSATMTVLNDGAEDLASDAYNVYGANNGILAANVFNSSDANLGVLIQYEAVNGMEEGPNIPQLVLIDATQSSNANANTLLLAILNGLNGSTPANALDTVSPL